MENKTTLWEAKTIIEKKNPTLGFLLERSLTNGTARDDGDWNYAYTDGTYDEEFIKDLKDGYSESEVDSFKSECDEKREQIIEIAKLLGISLKTNEYPKICKTNNGREVKILGHIYDVGYGYENDEEYANTYVSEENDGEHKFYEKTGNLFTLKS